MDNDGLHGSTDTEAGRGRSAPAPKRRAGRRKDGAKMRLTCANCRIRKVRCEGGQPTCKTCEAYHDECRYERPPPMTQILAMARQLQEAQETIARLRESGERRPTGGDIAISAIAQDGPIDPDLTLPQNLGEDEIRPPGDLSHSGDQKDATESPSQDMPLDLSLDKNGKICYYGPTSAVHDPPSLDAPSPQNSHYDGASKSEARLLLVSKAKEWRMWEDFALRNAASQSSVPQQVMAQLLQLHWAWISPMFMWVYRPAFMRDMATGGPYYSEFLLVVLCAHAARYTDADVANMMISRARMLLGSAIHQPSSIPTVQALLQLSARDLAYGSISQAWLYSGMAFRMVRDLGLHHSGIINPSLRELGPVDMEVRQRLFWSCYFWDKAISLYTGRMPALTELPDTGSFQLLDDSSESEIWSPFQTETFSTTRLAAGEYPPMKNHQVSCFVNSCKISVIVNDIILKLYSRRGTTNMDGILKQINANLREWRNKSPAHLRYDPDDLPEICPPPHILCQNLLYYTTVILAHRPFWAVTFHYQACISAARSIEKLLLLLERTFGFDNITYLMAYCVYTGASVILHDANHGNVEASAKLQTFIRALECGSKRCPLLQRSLDLIHKGRKPPVAQSSPQNSGQAPPAALAATPGYIPAFPYLGLENFGEPRMFGDLGGMSLDPFSTLNGFPEGQMDTESWYW